MSDSLSQFIGRVDAFLLRTGMAETSFGRMACNDSRFVRDLRDGREARFSTIEKVDRFMAEFAGDVAVNGEPGCDPSDPGNEDGPGVAAAPHAA